MYYKDNKVSSEETEPHHQVLTSDSLFIAAEDPVQHDGQPELHHRRGEQPQPPIIT